MQKVKVDRLLKKDDKIQKFLSWVNDKAESVETNNEAAVVRVFYTSLDLNLDLELDIPQDLKETLQKLKTQLPQEDKDPKIIKQWFLDNGKPWSNQFRDAVIQMMKERNIGYEWQFTKEQKESFLEYVNANNLLLDCLEDKNNYITRTVREEIESTLYLPFKEVENQFRDSK